MENESAAFRAWIDEHRSFLKPPVCNKKVFVKDDFIVTVVGGPNAREAMAHEDLKDRWR